MIGLEFLINIYGLKNKDIANTLGISPVTVHDWIKGKRKIPPARIEELSNIFKYIPKRYFQKELNELDKLKIQNTKLHREADDQLYEDNIEHERLQSKTEVDLEELELNEAIKFVNENIAKISKMEYNDMENITYSLKAFFDIYNCSESNLIGFDEILYLIANYLNIEGYRDEDGDDGLEYVDSPFEWDIERKKKMESFEFDKKLFELLSYRKQVEKEYQKSKNAGWDDSE